MTSKKHEGDTQDASIFPTAARGGRFEIRVKGHLDQSWSEWLEGLDVRLLEDGQMLLSGHVVDQAALMGILTRLHSLNLTLMSVNEASPDK